RRIRRDKAVVDSDDELVTSEAKTLRKRRFALELVACFERALDGVAKPSRAALSLVLKTEAPARLVRRIMRLLGYQYNAGAVMNVAVVGDIDRELVEHTFLNPAMKDRDEFLRRDAGGVDGENFYEEARVHHSAGLGVSLMRP